MYVVELSFDDRTDRLELRLAHRERLQELHRSGSVVLAGPFADESGALLILDVASESEVDRILDDDPYYGAPGVTVVRRQEWTSVVG